MKRKRVLAELAAKRRIRRLSPSVFTIKSRGEGRYTLVLTQDGGVTCSCPAFDPERGDGIPCWHRKRVARYLLRNKRKIHEAVNHN